MLRLVRIWLKPCVSRVSAHDFAEMARLLGASELRVEKHWDRGGAPISVERAS